jgi:hypothetical protein
MKKIVKSTITVLIIFLILVSMGIIANAQSDSIMVESEISTERNDYYTHKYQYLEVSLSDQSRLFKFALQPFKPSGNYDFGVVTLQLAYERKINKSFSVVHEINSNLNWLDSAKLYNTNFAIGSRFYPGLKQRIENGKSGINCNGYYIGIKANVLKSIAFQNEKQGYSYDRSIILYDPTPEFSVGLQQRISSLFYIDANAFVNYSFLDGPGYGIVVLLGISLNVED